MLCPCIMLPAVTDVDSHMYLLYLQELPAAELDAMCKEQFYPKVSECLRFEQPCLNACNRRGLCYHGFCKCFPGAKPV